MGDRAIYLEFAEKNKKALPDHGECSSVERSISYADTVAMNIQKELVISSLRSIHRNRVSRALVANSKTAEVVSETSSVLSIVT